MSRLRRQRGAALLLFLVIAVIAFTTAMMAGFGKWSSPTTASRNVNADVLAEAKRALIGYIAKEVLDLTENVPGRFPCPESPAVAGTDGEGVAAATCSKSAATQKTLGRLPWRTLGVDKLVDAAGEPLWYAVSQDWVTTGGGPPTINVGTAGSLSFDGTSNVVAVIFAPGRPISAKPTAAQPGCIASGATGNPQFRIDRSHIATSTADPDYRDYLECSNAASPVDDTFGVAVTDNATNAASNDQAIFITAAEVLNAIQGPLAQRLQRTVAPLLNELSKSWVASGTILPAPANTVLPRFMPYAAPFVAPETVTQAQSCGSSTTPTREGLLPAAAMAVTGTCATAWGSFTWSGSIGATGCATDSTTGAVTCQFSYYTLRTITVPGFGSVNLFQYLGIASPANTNVTLQAVAPYGASTFRKSLSASDFSISPSSKVTSASFTQTPSQANGSAMLSVQLQVADSALCVNTGAPFNIVCSALGTVGGLCSSILGPVCSLIGSILSEALTTSHSVTVTFPALSDPANLQGTELTAAGLSVAPPLNLLNPGPSQPHYWFFKNEWYRYTYYAVAPDTSAAQGGGKLSVNSFPPEYGSINYDKRFVLTLVGPAVASQTSRPSTSVAQYLEGDNKSSGDNSFAYQVFSDSGNDRLATCPFSSGASICD